MASRLLLSSAASSAASTSKSVLGALSDLSLAHTTAARTFSSSVPAPAKRTTKQSRLIRKRNLEKRALQARLFEASKPDPVLGHQLNAEGQAKWDQCELNGIILTKDEVWGVKEDRRGQLQDIDTAEATTSENILKAQDKLKAKRISEKFGGPLRLNFGLNDKTSRTTLFGSLPSIMTEDRILGSPNLAMRNPEEVKSIGIEMDAVRDEELQSASTLGRILDLRNASGKGIQAENIRRILRAFGGGKGQAATEHQRLDTGSPEAQVAVLTYRIRNLHGHLAELPHDNSNRRAMASLVYQRARLLKYLRRQDEKRYSNLLDRIGVEPRAVEGEVVVPGRERLTRRG